MATATELRRGMIVIHKGDLYLVRDTQHVTPGNWRGMVQTHLRSLKTGKTIQERFRSTEDVEIAYIDSQKYQYLYEDASGYVFMDIESYDQLTVSKDIIGDRGKYLTDNLEVRINFYENAIIDVVFPSQIVATITFAPTGDKGDTVSNITKPATVDKGFDVQVPLFIKQGDKIRISTEDGSYLGKD